MIKLVGSLIPSDNETYQEEAIAAQSIGWTAKKIVFNGTVEDLNAKFEEAISDKPTVITLSGWPPASIETPLADAKKAGIVVSLSAVVDAPTSNPGYAAQSNAGPTAQLIGQILAYQFMRASSCKGNVAIFNLPNYPITKVDTDSFTQTVQAHCPECKVSYSEIQASDIGTPAATTAIVSRLQASASTKYVYLIIGNLADGLTTALSQANITGVQIFGQVPDDAAIKALRDGTNAWWVDQSSLMNGWGELDAALRAIDSGGVVSDNGHYPLALLTPQNIPAGTSLPTFPTDYRSEFEKLWHVG